MKLDNKDELYDYYFHYNIYTKEWNAFKRDIANQYLNGTLTDVQVMKAKNIDDLVKYVSFTKRGFKRAKKLNEQ